MPPRISLTTKGFGRVERLLNRRGFNTRLQREVTKATKLNAIDVENETRKTIKGGKLAANRPMTVAIKGSSKPLIGADSVLFGSITHKIKMRGFAADVGVLRARKVDDTDIRNIAFILHEGATMPVTDKMRKLFASREREGISGWRALKHDTTELIIKPRPFLRVSFRRRALQQRIRRRWREASGRALRGGR